MLFRPSGKLDPLAALEVLAKQHLIHGGAQHPSNAGGAGGAGAGGGGGARGLPGVVAVVPENEPIAEGAFALLLLMAPIFLRSLPGCFSATARGVPHQQPMPSTACPVIRLLAAASAELERRADAEEDFFKRNAYRKAIPAVRNCSFQITSVRAQKRALARHSQSCLAASPSWKSSLEVSAGLCVADDGLAVRRHRGCGQILLARRATRCPRARRRFQGSERGSGPRSTRSSSASMTRRWRRGSRGRRGEGPGAPAARRALLPWGALRLRQLERARRCTAPEWISGRRSCSRVGGARLAGARKGAALHPPTLLDEAWKMRAPLYGRGEDE